MGLVHWASPITVGLPSTPCDVARDPVYRPSAASALRLLACGSQDALLMPDWPPYQAQG
jgi:hypothetical protein